MDRDKLDIYVKIKWGKVHIAFGGAGSLTHDIVAEVVGESDMACFWRPSKFAEYLFCRQLRSERP
jgi:hypothetical protein